MRDDLEQLFLGNTVVERPLEVTDLLLGAIERDQGGTGDQAAVALAEPLALPDVAEQDVVGQVDQLRREGPQGLSRRRSRCRWLGHFSPPLKTMDVDCSSVSP